MSDESYVEIASDGRDAILTGKIDAAASSKIVHWITEQSFKGEKERLYLTINSTGGCLSHAMAIVDAMAMINIPVYTTGIGCVASAALLVFVAGADRTLTSNTSIMTHQPWDTVEGRDLDFEAMEDYRELCKKRLLQHYEACTGMEIEAIKMELFGHKDRYLTAKEAYILGLCDSIVYIPALLRTDKG